MDYEQNPKAIARKQAYDRRKLAFSPAAAITAAHHLLDFLGTDSDQPVAGYMPIRTEISPLPAMAELARTRPVGVPVILGPALPLEFHRWHPDMAMQPGAFGALIPVEAEIVNPYIVIVPLAAFDGRGNRLGYGGGFYDRTLQLLRARRPIQAIGLAFAAQQTHELPTEPTDQPLDFVVTEQGVLRCDR